MKRLLFITMIILLLIFMITPSIVYGAINPEDLIIRRENSENLNYNTINEKITTNLRMYAIITIIVNFIGFIMCPLLLFIGIILNIKNKENSNSKKGIALIISAIILFIMCMIIKIILQVKWFIANVEFCRNLMVDKQL